MRARGACALLLSFLVAAPIDAGLRFRPAPAPDGAQASSLLADGSTLWLGTVRGVWRLSAGQWSLDGLSDQSISSLATAAGSLFAATGDVVYRRAADGTYTRETLPKDVYLPAVLVADGTTLYAGGLGVARRSSGTWTALPSPGAGFVIAATLDAGSLVVGLDSGRAARLLGNTWTTMQTGLGDGEAPAAFASLNGTLICGTTKAIYSWTGTSWLKDATFPAHDVRSLAVVNGELWAATFDAGVFHKSASGWTAENAGLLASATRSLAVLSGTLHVATNGAPVYARSGSSWAAVGAGSLGASVVSDVLTGGKGAPGNGDVWVSTRGGGALKSSVIPGASPVNPLLPDGCGDVRALAFTAGTASGDVLLASSCGGFTSSGLTYVPASSGLPPAASLLSLATTSSGVEGGTDANATFRFSGDTWSPDANGLAPKASVRVLRRAGSLLYAGLDQGLSAQDGSGSWADASSGLPVGAVVAGLGGDNPAFAGLLTNGVYRRDGLADWKSDSLGLSTSSVTSLDVSAGRLYAGASTRGVYVKRDGLWAPESSGLPPGADVRVVRDGRFDGNGGTPASRGLYAGTAGHGLFYAPSVSQVKTIPVVLDVVGGTGARFRTELTIGNRGAQPATAQIRFDAAPGFGAGSAPSGPISITIPAGTELRAPDALGFLRGQGLAIPVATSSSPIAGSLSVSAGLATDPLYAIARTYTGGGDAGTYGLFYDAPSDLEAAEDEATIYGLRSIAGVSRSNLAVAALPGRDASPTTLQVQVYNASGTAVGSPLQRTLQPGEWYQWNGILGLANLPEGSYGYARITRVAGSGAWVAYGVVNDAATSDGSYLPAFRLGGAAASRTIVVPVVLDVYGAAGSHYTTELTLANDGLFATQVALTYKPAPGFGSSGGVPNVLVSMSARSQQTIPDVLQYMRDRGVTIPDGSTGPQAGTLTVEFRYPAPVDTARTVALARTSTPNTDAATGGSFGLFYAAAAKGGGARTSAVVPSLTQDASVRSNLAVVHLGGGSEKAMTLSVQLYDAATGVKVGNALGITLFPGDWYQWSRVLEAAGAITSTTKAYAVVTRVSGDDTFYAYGVANDAVTSDGSFLKMIPSDGY